MHFVYVPLETISVFVTDASYSASPQVAMIKMIFFNSTRFSKQLFSSSFCDTVRVIYCHISLFLVHIQEARLPWYVFVFIAKPSAPAILNLEKLNCWVNLTWSVKEDAHCPLSEYTIHYRQIQGRGSKKDSWSKIEITTASKNNHRWSLQCDTQYEFSVSAWNMMGQSNMSATWQIKTESPRGESFLE